MKRADVNSKNFPPFRREKGSPSPCLGALLDPSCQETIPSACSDKLIPENVFFPSSPFSPSCYNVFSIFNPQPSKLPSSLQTLSDEWSFKNRNLNAGILQLACLSSFIPQSRQSFCVYSSAGFVCHASVSGRYYFSSRCLLWADVKLFVRRNSRAVQIKRTEWLQRIHVEITQWPLADRYITQNTLNNEVRYLYASALHEAWMSQT